MAARKPFIAVIGAVVLVVAVIVVAVIWANNSVFAGSNGERIYFTATNDRGERISYRGYADGFGPGMMMDDRLSCASCHGGDARGGEHMMHMQVMDAPEIRWSALTGESAEEQADDAHEHAHTGGGYGLAEFRRAVVQGEHPDGEPLSSDMPRWNIDDDDLADLAEFLDSPDLAERGDRMMPWMDGVWIIFPILGLIIMVLFIVLMVGRMGGFFPRRDYTDSSSMRSSDAPQSETPLTILQKRYASGEIGKEEYEEMKKELQ
jgi:uncharacterized membrane protein